MRAAELDAKHDSLTRQLSAARERTSQLQALNSDLRQQVLNLGVDAALLDRVLGLPNAESGGGQGGGGGGGGW